MVPADDERTDSPEATSNTSTKEQNSGRLTRMPDCLMHWWTPLLVAAILFGPSLILAIIWGGQPHWPSSAAMTLCATIAGGGFAFSAWQQRSHDNATKENEQAQAQRELEADRQDRERIRLEQIERDEYWKRREQIYQLLGSKNPGLRLGAVALLAELADSAAHSALLNDTEKQQLQRHIIDTLCLQVRHEGLDHNNEGFRDERARIQTAIIETILVRIASHPKTRPYANWSTYSINLSNCEIFTSIQITNLNSTAALNFNNTTFHESAIIRDSKIGPISWDKATFTKGLQAIGTSTRTTIKTNTIPQSPQTISFRYVTFITERPTFQSTQIHSRITARFNPEHTSTSATFARVAATAQSLAPAR